MPLFCPMRYSILLIWLILQQFYIPAAPQTLLSRNDTDRLALMSFRSLLMNTMSPSQGVLLSWNHSVDYCYWEGVQCGAPRHPGRVTNLTLSSMQLTGTLSPSLANLSFLRQLHLGDNGFYGKIPSDIGLLRRLERLNLSSNSLEGDIPASLGGCPNLISLRLQNNMLQGGIPPELGSLSNLVVLNLNSNNLTGNLPLSLGNLSNLYTLQVAFNNLKGNIPVELGKIAGLGLLNLLFNRFHGQVPWELYNLSSLFGLGLGHNQLSGILPPDYGRNLPELETLYLYANQFQGPIPPSITNATKLREFDLSDNLFSGSLPLDIGNLGSLQSLRLADNRLETRTSDDSRFFTSLVNCKSLNWLDLSRNFVTGPIPESIGNLSLELRTIKWSGNLLLGPIPESLGNLSNLVTLVMQDNQLWGRIPDAFGNLIQLEALYLHGNKLFGEIPASLGKLTKMNELFLSRNGFIGNIPNSFASFRQLGMFDISYNNLTGAIPTGLFTISSLSNFLNLSHNSFDGPLPVEVGKLTNLKILDVSWNKFSGPIPPSLGDSLVLEYLYLQGNQFNGSIPERLKDIKGIQVLDLSKNQLSGSIPKFLQNLEFEFLNLSFNNFESEVPIEGVFSNVTLFSIIGNSKLCAGNSKLYLKPCARKSHKSSSYTSAIIIALSVVSCLLLFACLIFLTRGYYKKTKASPKYPTDGLLVTDQMLRVSYADIFEATSGFSSSSIIGCGGSGTVYKCYLKYEEKVVAVKVLHRNLHGALNGFVNECEVLRNLRHRNLVRILTTCVSADHHGNEFRALIYEFMPNGSLDKWLHRKPSSGRPNNFVTANFGLLQRLNIAIDIASALDYLHNHTTTPVVHRDLKPSNILLNEDMTACLSDFGISTFLSLSTNSTSIGVKGSLGYIAPECGIGKSVTISWDVYSFGVVLLEMFTGKGPTDKSFVYGTSLHRYVHNHFSTSLMEILDPILLQDESCVHNRARECIMSIINVALICSNELPGDRMMIGEVLKLLQDARNALICGN